MIDGMSHETLDSDLFVVSQEESALRLDKLLALHFPEHSRTYFQYLIEEGLVLVNGSMIKKREKPCVGDEIDVCFQLTPEISLEPEAIPLEILYEDEHLLAINKPAGMVVHPAPGHPRGTFVNALLHHCRSLESKDPLRPGIVHRLDKETSGVLLAAKTKEAHQGLISLFSSRAIEKSYLCITVSTPREGLIDHPIKRHPIHRKQMAIDPTGKEARTLVRPLFHNEHLAVVEVQLLTGRTHQIRVHLKSLGTPVLGDPIYGSDSANKKFNATRQLLHAHRLFFLHPVTKQPLQILAPLPDDVKKFIEHIQAQ
jgi:23S rRNA pseudouridine1911/1915/1917 synthase